MAKVTTKIISTSRPVKTSCKNTKVRSAAGECVTGRPTMKKGGSTKSFPDLNKDGKVTKADILIGKKVIPKAKTGGSVHPGFKAVQSKIAAKQGISKEAAGAILASSTRKASTKAKAANPRLKKVK